MVNDCTAQPATVLEPTSDDPLRQGDSATISILSALERGLSKIRRRGQVGRMLECVFPITVPPPAIHEEVMGGGHRGVTKQTEWADAGRFRHKRFEP